MFKYPWKCPGISLGGVLPWWKASGKVWGSLIIYIAPFHIFLQCAKSFNDFNNVWVINYFSISQLLRKIAWARVSCSQHSCSGHISSACPMPLAQANRIHMWKWWLHIWAGCHFYRHQACDFILPLWCWQGTRSPKYETFPWNKIPLKCSLYGLKEKTGYAKQKQMGHSYFCPVAELHYSPSLLGFLFNSANIMNIEFQISQVRPFFVLK